MKTISLIVSLLLFVSASAANAASPDQAAFQNWAGAARVPGYDFGGVDQPDPGIHMAVWMNAKGEMIAVRMEPSSNLKSYMQTTNRKKPVSISYRGMPALYIDALQPSAMLVVNHEKSGKLLVVANQNQPRAMSREQLEKLLDAMKPETLLK